MNVPRPHFLLFCDGSYPTTGSHVASSRGRWRFVLEDVEGGERLEAADAEANQAPDRIALLAVVRGLEALSQPSRVTMVTSSRYVHRGFQYGLPEWRENDYCWEHFGAQQPIRNADLWRRIDQALQYHTVHCRLMTGEETATTVTSVRPLDEGDDQNPDRLSNPTHAIPPTSAPPAPTNPDSLLSFVPTTDQESGKVGGNAIENGEGRLVEGSGLASPLEDRPHRGVQQALEQVSGKISGILQSWWGNREVLAGA